MVTSAVAPATVSINGPSTIGAGKKYRAMVARMGRASYGYWLGSPAPHSGLSVSQAGVVTFMVPRTHVSSFSYSVVITNAAGQAESSVVKVTVTKA